MVAVGVEFGGVEWVAAFDFHAVFEFLDLGTHGAEVVDDGGDAIGFLDAEFAGVADGGFALGEGGGDGDDGDFVDEVGDFLWEEGGSGEGSAVDFDVADGFAFGLVEGVDHAGSHAAEDVEDGGAGGVEADVVDDESGAGEGGCGDEPEGGGGDVSGDGEVAGFGGLSAVDGDGVGVAAGGDAEGGEHALGVVAGFCGLCDGGFALGEEAGEEDGAFDLGGGDGHFVGDGLEFGAVDEEWGAAGFFAFGFDVCAHLGEWDGDAAHGAGGE